MANAKSSIILQEGLNSIHASPFGSHFALKYWLPIYDPRIDEEIHSGTQAVTSSVGTDPLELSATLITSHEYADLEGEKLFNADSAEYQSFLGVSDATYVYSLPDTRDYVVSAMSSGQSVAYSYTGTVSSDATSISNSSQERGVIPNLVTSGTQTISKVLSATTLTADTSGGFAGTGIGVMPQISEISYALAGGVNTSATGLLYPVASFTSVVVSGNNVDAGKYAIRLTANHGDFRFNKFVLFAVKMNADGTEDTSVLPVPFSVTSFEGTNKKLRNSDDGTGIQWSGVIQLAFQVDPSLNNLTNLIIDNWTDLDTSAFGLATNKKVHIHDSDGWYEANTKLTVTDNERTQLRLAYDENTPTTFNTDSNGDHTITVSGGQGNLVLSANDLNVQVANDVNITPSNNIVFNPSNEIHFMNDNIKIFNDYDGDLLGTFGNESGLGGDWLVLSANETLSLYGNKDYSDGAGIGHVRIRPQLQIIGPNSISRIGMLNGEFEGNSYLSTQTNGLTLSATNSMYVNAGANIHFTAQTSFEENLLIRYQGNESSTTISASPDDNYGLNINATSGVSVNLGDYNGLWNLGEKAKTFKFVGLNDFPEETYLEIINEPEFNEFTLSAHGASGSQQHLRLYAEDILYLDAETRVHSQAVFNAQAGIKINNFETLDTFRVVSATLGVSGHPNQAEAEFIRIGDCVSFSMPSILGVTELGTVSSYSVSGVPSQFLAPTGKAYIHPVFLFINGATLEWGYVTIGSTDWTVRRVSGSFGSGATSVMRYPSFTYNVS